MRKGPVAPRSAWLVSPLCGRRRRAHIIAMTKAIVLPALAALFLLCPPSGAQDNPLLSPAPGLPASPSPLDAELGRAQADMLRGGTDLSRHPDPDPMRLRDADALRLDAERAQRVLQDPPPPPVQENATRPDAPRIDPPAPRITHGRKKGAPTPAQSSPVPERKPATPPGP